MSPLRMLLILLSIACACASAPKSPAQQPQPTVAALPLPRSSVAAVLARRGELGLDEEQVKKLEQIEAELDKKNAQTRTDLAGPSGGSITGDTPGAQEQIGGRHRGRKGIAAEPGRPRPYGQAGRDRAGTPTSLEKALDDNDTQAFLTAESVLREGQRERARDIAEKYREDLYDQREQLHRQAPAKQ